MQLIDAAPLMHFPQPLRLRWLRRVLHFKRPAATSRGALTERTTCIIEASTPLGSGYGECCIMPGLLPEIQEEELDAWCRLVELHQGLPKKKLTFPDTIRTGVRFAGCDESRKPPLEYPFCTRGMRDSDSSPHLDGQLREHARSHAGWSEPGLHMPENEGRSSAL